MKETLKGSAKEIDELTESYQENVQALALEEIAENAMGLYEGVMKERHQYIIDRTHFKDIDELDEWYKAKGYSLIRELYESQGIDLGKRWQWLEKALYEN